MERKADIVTRTMTAAIGSLLALAMLNTFALAQIVEAKIASVSGNVARINRTVRFSVRRGDTLSPGDEIDTRGGGKATIQLTDGSLVAIQPGSHVILKDYRSANSLRELIQVFVGRVRVKINHYGGRPNPYRVNSPTASILVRGTEFAVTVGAAGETGVLVYEGLVEVESLSDPSRRALITPGNSVLVRPNEDLRFFTPGGGEADERGIRISENHLPLIKSDGSSGFSNIATGTARNYTAGIYERYIDSLVEPGESVPLLRFSAFPDSHLDSLENPSYATEFGKLESRSLVISSFSRNPINQLRHLRQENFFSSVEPLNTGWLTQNTVFLPLADTRWVMGGNFALSSGNVNAATQQETAGAPSPFFPAGTTYLRTASSETNASSKSGSLMLARSFGREGKTSFGFGIDRLNGRGKLRGETSLTHVSNATELPIFSAIETVCAESNIERTRLKLGLTHQFSGGHKLGVFYRHGTVSAQDQDVARTFNGLPLKPDSTLYSSRTNEIGMRLRGALARKLFYGVEGHWMTSGIQEQINRSVVVEAQERERITRSSASFGIGYALSRRTVFSADIAAGQSNVMEDYYEQATGNMIEQERARRRFVSAQLGVQSDLWKNLFGSVSLFRMAQSQVEDHKLFPDRFGRLLDINGLFVPDGIAKERFTDNYADFGFGWRVTRNVLAQYVLATSFGRQVPNHIFLLRYTFKREE